ncbi:hypothetical protein M427DRAFT_33409 [Gonapodya prolifera JEL478]|uniref:Uncharacterized protein n=1 Tax=Gonapodya prolifera (strain JEL478) TaxID=1344416 RepID=A0A139AAX0_GONPJ|nr:hypothetical protein M427DRAFT_33409 [Gonapodya prolifera JEL478]|eukprot:KXS13972.1 hypothetical protein M427DRAFT_33409 [Gonapodya prolifera JEL478]
MTRFPYLLSRSIHISSKHYLSDIWVAKLASNRQRTGPTMCISVPGPAATVQSLACEGKQIFAPSLDRAPLDRVVILDHPQNPPLDLATPISPLSCTSSGIGLSRDQPLYVTAASKTFYLPIFQEDGAPDVTNMNTYTVSSDEDLVPLGKHSELTASLALFQTVRKIP